MIQRLEKGIREQMVAYDARLGNALDQIEVAAAWVRDNPLSCLCYTGALIILEEAGVQSDEASDVADGVRKAIGDAHLAAVGDSGHNPCCAFSPPNSEQSVWFGEG